MTTVSQPTVPKKRNRAAREDALIAAASKLFASRGYEIATTRDIAAAAGCAEGLIHRYFGGKEGLLLALIKRQVSQEVVDLQTLPLASTMADEVVQLVEWEVEHTWHDREFFKVVIPRALLDPALGHLIDGIGPTQRARAITERLRNFTQCRALPAQEVEALAHFISITSFMFGFMRPAVLHQDRENAKKMAVMTAQMMVRNFETISTPDDSQPCQQKPASLFT
jgi:TetR/AcrR family transcriptional regulator, regulator of cefoperazone and chloramphenicol sensitivity